MIFFRRLYFTFILFLVIFNNLTGRDSINLDKTNLGIKYYNQALDLLYINYDSSWHYLDKAIPILLKTQKKEIYVDCLNGKFAIQYLKGDIIQAEKEALFAYETGKKLLKGTNKAFLSSINNLGVIYSERGNYRKAISLYNSVLTDSLIRIDFESYTKILYNISNFLERLGEFDKAIEYLNRILTLNIDSLTFYNETVGQNHISLGTCYSKKKEYAKAIPFYEDALKIYNSIQLNNSPFFVRSKIMAIQGLVNSFIELNNFDSAKYYLNQALKLHKKEGSFREYFTLESFGKIAVLKNEHNQSLELFIAAYEKGKIEFKGLRKLPIVARLITNIGDSYVKLGRLEEGLEKYQEALIENSFDFNNKNYTTNPPLNKLASQKEGIEILGRKADALYKHYLNEGNRTILNAAISSYDSLILLIREMRQELLTNESKSFLTENAHKYYEKYLSLLLNSSNPIENKNLTQKCFSIFEQNKALSLLEGLQSSKAKLFSEIPDSLIDKEKNLRLEIAFYKKKINKEQQKKAQSDTLKIKSWGNTLFNLQLRHNKLITRFEKTYPKYYNLKYKYKITTVKDIQDEILDRETAFLEYFIGEQNIFQFIITKDSTHFLNFSKPKNFDQKIMSFLSLVRQPPVQIDNAFFQNFTDLSHHLYESLIAPSKNHLDPNINRLIIIPDDILAYLPFELLTSNITNPKNGSLSFQNVPFLIKDYFINYSYSGTLLVDNFKKAIKGNKLKTFLGLAPSFSAPIAQVRRDCSTEELYNLQCSEQELTNIRSNLSLGNIYFGTKAKKELFLKEAPNYKILHLATHSCTDEDDPMYSKIFFHDDYLTNGELYNLQLNAELAVLSCCNTGSGKLVKGEGVLSLSRGFIYAGCPSTLMSLWSVDDCATSDIMTRFYKYLYEGKPKDLALRKAKLSYLEEADKLHQHPYYWAAFVQSGDYTSIKFNHLTHWGWKVIIALGLVALIGGLYLGKFRYKSSV